MNRSRQAPEQAKIIIDDVFYFTVNRHDMSLYRAGNKSPVAYFTTLEKLLGKVISLNTLNAAAKEKSMQLAQYIKLLRQERERIEHIAQGIQPPA